MQHEKCCYCEVKLGPCGYEKTVDHYRPQIHFSEQNNRWTNLLLACWSCNGKKGTNFPTTG
ncbi:MAG: HNH endonuclease, partial [Planctomycetes bacterium]|nr:HNH endonuclease [Planctomycetota bacterium]